MNSSRILSILLPHIYFIMKKIIIVRHGQTNANVEGITQGQIDSELNELGISQAKKTGKYINDNFSIDEAWVSDLSRTKKTASFITKNFSTTELIREMSFGDWENHHFEEIGKKFPKQVEEYLTASENFKAPNGESYTDMHDRGKKFLERIDYNEQSVTLIVSHGGFMRVLIPLIMGLPKKSLLNFQFENCSITELNFPKKDRVPILNRINYTDHLN